MINHSDRGITHPSDTDTVQSETYHDKSLIEVSLILVILIQYSQKHTMINHCDRGITHPNDTDISFVLLNISSKFLSYLECYLPKRHKKVSK
jgi:hypothetical protein